MVRLTTLLLFVSLFGVVMNVEVFDLVNGIASLSAFIPGVGDLLSKAIKLTNSVVKLTRKNNFIHGRGLDPHNSFTAKQLQKLMEGLDQSKLDIPSEVEIRRSLDKVYDIVATIRSNYNQYLFKYRVNGLKYNSKDAMSFVKLFYVKFNLKSELDKIEQTLIGDRQTSNLLKGLGVTQDFEVLLCSKATSHQMRIIQINHDILEAEMKALELAKFRFLVADLNGSCEEKPDHLVEFEYFLESFVNRTRKMQSKIREAVKKAPREFWGCDPVIPVEGETYVKLDPVFRRYITQETDLNKNLRPRDNTLGGVAFQIYGDCDRYQFAYIRNGTEYAKKSPCRGVVRNCHDSEEGVRICFEESGDEYKYGSVKSLGSEMIWGKGAMQCESSVNIERHLTTDGWNDVCLCTCDEKDREQAVRYFSFLECSSDYNENKVITGVRLIKRDDLFIHFEIQQAVMGKNADIDKDNIEPDHQIDDHLPRKAGNKNVLDKIGKSVSFRKSNDEEDAGSSLVPWIDTQKVFMENPAPLAGISLILKNSPQSSGYIALKITSLDFSYYFQSDSDEYLWQLVSLILEQAKNVTDTRCSELQK
ncbi:hypothetical protein QAD02_018198 [Eretmocerus hayati]|uniref:Uncharacterized protein n=1 Tax=Eretmocerus hayati TaxID=131215 RepID=A0ACC2PHX9_9HYME|nr:hypothetical protein QAD02_018198 [Eretmocerus hayati]